MPNQQHRARNLVVLNGVLDDGIEDGEVGGGRSEGTSASLAGHFPRRRGGEEEDHKAESASELLHAVSIASAVASDVN
jgi:hypothetical protein